MAEKASVEDQRARGVGDQGDLMGTSGGSVSAKDRTRMMLSALLHD